jgi:sugar phosphate isomerase/epimerase
MGMTITGRTQPLSELKLAECLSRLHSLGFDGVEICLEHPDLEPRLLTRELAREVDGQLASSGMDARSVSYHRDYTRDDDVFEDMKRVIELTPLFGASIFVIGNTFACAPDGGGEGEDVWPRLVSRTRELARVAASHGVMLAEEAEPGFVVASTADLLRLFDDVASDALGANLDLGHAFLTDPDPIHSIELVGGRIVHCHVENMGRGVHKHMLPHEGDMDLVAYFAALRRAGFAGPMALDLYGYDYAAVAPDAIRFLRECLAAAAEARIRKDDES